MKNNLFRFGFFVLFIMACTIFITGCDDDPVDQDLEEWLEEKSWLVGTWYRDAALGRTQFTITKEKEDFSFVCDLFVQVGDPGRVYGNFGKPPTGRGGHNHFLLKDMKGAEAGDPDATYNDGNTTLRSQVGAFNNIMVTQTPNAEITEFTFTTAVPAAALFFGGTYTKVTE